MYFGFPTVYSLCKKEIKSIFIFYNIVVYSYSLKCNSNNL